MVAVNDLWDITFCYLLPAKQKRIRHIMTEFAEMMCLTFKTYKVFEGTESFFQKVHVKPYYFMPLQWGGNSSGL